jgi:hypothetical protein
MVYGGSSNIALAERSDVGLNLIVNAWPPRDTMLSLMQIERMRIYPWHQQIRAKRWQWSNLQQLTAGTSHRGYSIHLSFGAKAELVPSESRHRWRPGDVGHSRYQYESAYPRSYIEVFQCEK